MFSTAAADGFDLTERSVLKCSTPGRAREHASERGLVGEHLHHHECEEAGGAFLFYFFLSFLCSFDETEACSKISGHVTRPSSFRPTRLTPELRCDVHGGASLLPAVFRSSYFTCFRGVVIYSVLNMEVFYKNGEPARSNTRLLCSDLPFAASIYLIFFICSVHCYPPAPFPPSQFLKLCSILKVISYFQAIYCMCPRS